MKNVMRLVLLTLFAVVGSTVMAQQVKLGYINSQELFVAMPERQAAIEKIEAYATELQDQLDLIQVEMNTKFQEYQKNLSTYTDAIKTMKENELNSISTRLQESQQVAEQDLQRMQNELMSPIFDQLTEAIKKVAKENNITAVFDLAAGAMLYYDESTMVDMLPLAKRSLGIN